MGDLVGTTLLIMAANEKQWSSATPGLLIFLIDQSGSMLNIYEGGETRSQFASKAVNRMIDNIIQANFNGDTPKNRCYVSVIGYNHNVKPLCNGYLKELDESPLRLEEVTRKISDGAGGIIETKVKMPIWVEPIKEDGATNMKGAFEMAKEVVEKWISDFPDRPAPVIVNISDGIPFYDRKDVTICMQETIQTVNQIKAIDTPDGKIQIFNAMIGNGPKVKYPVSKNSVSTEADFLFEISTEIPDAYRPVATARGLDIPEGARGCICQCDGVELIQLIDFGSSKGQGDRM